MAVICGVDRSPAARTALRWASREARLRAEPLIVVHAYLRPLAYGPASAGVLDAEPEHQRAQQLLAELLRAERDRLAGLRVEQQVHSGNAASALVQAVGAADLLVVGSRGAGGFEGLLLGSTAEHCARHAVPGRGHPLGAPGASAPRRDRRRRFRAGEARCRMGDP